MCSPSPRFLHSLNIISLFFLSVSCLFGIKYHGVFNLIITVAHMPAFILFVIVLRSSAARTTSTTQKRDTTQVQHEHLHYRASPWKILTARSPMKLIVCYKTVCLLIFWVPCRLATLQLCHFLTCPVDSHIYWVSGLCSFPSLHISSTSGGRQPLLLTFR